MAVEVRRLVVVFVGPPLVVIAAGVVVEEGFLEAWGVRQSGFAAFPRGVGQELPHVLECCSDREDAFFVVA